MAQGEGDSGLGGLFEDLEQQAAGIHYAERDAELLDRARGEYATVTFASRVHASSGRPVSLVLVDGSVVEGSLSQVGTDWCALRSADGGSAWLVRLAAVATARGLSPRSLPEAARPALARLGFGSALHRLASEAPEVLLHLVATGPQRIRVVRIGADFVEVEPSAGTGPAETTVVPFSAVVAARSS
jgi:hypothetical protein